MAYSIQGNIWDGTAATPGILHIKSDGTIKGRIEAPLKEHHDFGDATILPGAIDIHVHFRDPGHSHKEDVTSGSTSAAFGGVVGFVDMPNTVPPTTTTKAIEAKLARFAEASIVDYGVWAGGTWFTEDLEEMLNYAVGVKTYLGATTGDLLLEDPEPFKRILAACAKSGKPLILHCEAQRVLDRLKRNEVTVVDHDQSRPPTAEVEAIYDVMKAIPGIKPAPRVHIAHIASKEAVHAAKSAKFSMGVCPHHLFLHTGGEWQHGYGKVNPPLRDASQNAALLAALVDGTIPIVESDHAPHTRAEKEQAFHTAPAGLPGVETLLPMLLAEVAAGRLELKTVVDSTSRAPADLLNLSKRGRLEAGAAADFIVVDMNNITSIKAKQLHSKCGWSPYDGMDAIFPSHVYVRGEPVIVDGKLKATPGQGKSLLA